MEYISTRSGKFPVSAAFAIKQGLAPDGGLFTPSNIPLITLKEIEAFEDMEYSSLAADILSRFLSDYSKQEISDICQKAYGNRFDTKEIAPLKAAGSNFFLELWHGPTCAFKDMALQILPFLLTVALKKTNEDKTVLILVATSGDTGKAALDGFMNVPDTKIAVFYPKDGVSLVQQLQMTTQEGDNVQVIGINGNFDDAQTGVKEIFSSLNASTVLSESNTFLSSANSINWGRLAPQIAYYFSAYSKLVDKGVISLGDKINFTVPTGNFGNILAGFIAKKMGLPVNKFICASNANHILTDFLSTGIYDRNRSFYTTMSPSMDILISSNLERLLFYMSNENFDKINQWMSELKTSGYYEVDTDTLSAIKTQFYGGYCDEFSTKSKIQSIFEEYGYVCDTHTAVAAKVYDDYLKNTDDKAVNVIVSTASPYKFPKSVCEAITGTNFEDASDKEAINILFEKTGVPVPEGISKVFTLPVRFNKFCAPSEMESTLLNLFKTK